MTTNTKTKIHTVYKTQDGQRVPSVTTILGILNKPALLEWAWKCGCEGLDYKKVRDTAGDIGTLAHYLIMCYLNKETPDTSEYSKESIGKAENCLLSFFEWHKANPVKPVIVEEPMVSEFYGFGGTIDCLGELNGELWLVDFKTGKAIYPEMISQLAAYRVLLAEHGHEIANARIVRIGRDEDEGFEERVITNLSKEWQVFEHCLKIYNLQKEIRKDK